MLQVSREELATTANMSARTIADFETGKRRPINSTLLALQAALEDAGIRFTPEGGIIPPNDR